jgi:hypothetical protein
LLLLIVVRNDDVIDGWSLGGNDGDGWVHVEAKRMLEEE